MDKDEYLKLLYDKLFFLEEEIEKTKIYLDHQIKTAEKLKEKIKQIDDCSNNISLRRARNIKYLTDLDEKNHQQNY